jgi:PAS domain-containing protein
MAQQPLELILARQFADSMNMAIFLVDTQGDLLFYNEPAEELLGIRFAETGKMKMEDWATRFKPTNFQGEPLPPESLPLVQTAFSHKPANASFYIYDTHGVQFEITVTSIPIQGKPDRFLGAMALFWKIKLA